MGGPPAEGPSPQQERYRSPLMRRLDNTPRLTIELLRAEVPIYQAGRRADQLLVSGDVPAEQRDELVRAKAASEAAKERLVLAAIPFIHHLARRERQRRQAWQSPVSLDDLVHDRIVGLLMGLARFDPQMAGFTHQPSANGSWS